MIKVRSRKKSIDFRASKGFSLFSSKNEEKHIKKELKTNWWHEDGSSVLLLLFLYVLQGIPLGLAASIPILLASRSVDYKQQALFSFVFWPFSIKLLWAPIVDGAYIPRFGRRKSWLVPTQYCIAAVMYILSQRLHDSLEASNLDIRNLTVCFFILNFCAATQDIAVDGWALTMLPEKNVGLASTCNSVGQSAGQFFGYAVFLALESAKFCNNYLRTEPQSYGVVTLSSFLYFWSIVFFLTTTFVMLFKTEVKSHSGGHEESKGVLSTYLLLWRIVKLPSVLEYVFVLLTTAMAFGSESLVGLKLIECGIRKESLALLSIPQTPLRIFLPLVITKYTSGSRPFDILLQAYKFRLLFIPLFALMIHWTPLFREEDGTYPYSYFIFIAFIYCFYQVTLCIMSVAMMAFNAKVSDPRIGGTYMTLLNTVANLGNKWPATLALWYVDSLTANNCVNGNVKVCTKTTQEACIKSGGYCDMSVDGYYVESTICFIIGIAWLVWKSKATRKLQDIEPEKWKCPN